MNCSDNTATLSKLKIWISQQKTSDQESEGWQRIDDMHFQAISPRLRSCGVFPGSSRRYTDTIVPPICMLSRQPFSIRGTIILWIFLTSSELQKEKFFKTENLIKDNCLKINFDDTLSDIYTCNPDCMRSEFEFEV